VKFSVCGHKRDANGAGPEENVLACPSQWEAVLDDGRAVYARFRHGHLGVGTGETVERAVDNAMSDQALYEGKIGEGLDGFMDFEELKARLRGLIEFQGDLDVEDENPPGLLFSFELGNETSLLDPLGSMGAVPRTRPAPHP
jgi:hypothetical protein